MAIRSSREFLLALLLDPGSSRSPEPIQGITKLEKMCFLGRRDPVIGAVCEAMEFEPDNFGPYSAKIKDDLEYLKDLGLVEIGPPANEYPRFDELGIAAEEGGPGGPVRYSLTRKGVEIAGLLWKQFTSAEQKAIHQLKATYNGWNLDQLVRYVYQNSEPKWISKSTIAQRYT